LDQSCVHIIISGRVQGVWFRGWIAKQAEALQIRGWVRNRVDGSVEAVFTGAQHHVDEMIKRCQSGPPLARVDHMDVTPTDDDSLNGFEKRPTV
jgi:acylphosphatase